MSENQWETIEDLDREIKENEAEARRINSMQDPSAQYNMGYRYFSGIDVPVNYKLAAQWFQKAAQQGHVNAQYYLGKCYQEGKGVYKDEDEALKWYNLASMNGGLEIAEDDMGSLLLLSEKKRLDRDKHLNENTKKKKKTRSWTSKDRKAYLLSIWFFMAATIFSIVGLFLGKSLRNGDLIQSFCFLGLCAAYGFCCFGGAVNIIHDIGPFFGILIPIACIVLFICNYLQLVPVIVTAGFFLFSLLRHRYIYKRTDGQWKISKRQFKKEKQHEKELIEEYRRTHPSTI